MDADPFGNTIADGQYPYIQEIQIVTDRGIQSGAETEYRSAILDEQGGQDRSRSRTRLTRLMSYQEDGPRWFSGDEEGANAAAFKDDAAVVKIELRGDRLYNPNPSVSI